MRVHSYISTLVREEVIQTYDVLTDETDYGLRVDGQEYTLKKPGKLVVASVRI